MTGKKEKNKNDAWRWGHFADEPITACVLIVILGVAWLCAIAADYFIESDPWWIPWAITGVGLAGSIFYLRDIVTGKIKPPKSGPMTDEEYAQAKAELDMLYFKEHGKMPDETKNKPQ